jgi:hypothetical protein
MPGSLEALPGETHHFLLHPSSEGIARRHTDHVNARVAGREEFLIRCRGADERTRERLGTSDKGIVLYRRMLLEELAKVERGEDPLGVIRDPAKTRSSS